MQKYYIQDFSEGEKVFVFCRVNNENTDGPSITEYIIEEVNEKKLIAHKCDTPAEKVDFIYSRTYGVVEDNKSFVKSVMLKSKEEAEGYYEKIMLEKWFRLQFSKMPESDFSYEVIKQAKEILTNS